MFWPRAIGARVKSFAPSWISAIFCCCFHIYILTFGNSWVVLWSWFYLDLRLDFQSILFLFWVRIFPRVFFLLTPTLHRISAITRWFKYQTIFRHFFYLQTTFLLFDSLGDCRWFYLFTSKPSLVFAFDELPLAFDWASFQVSHSCFHSALLFFFLWFAFFLFWPFLSFSLSLSLSFCLSDQMCSSCFVTFWLEFSCPLCLHLPVVILWSSVVYMRFHFFCVFVCHSYSFFHITGVDWDFVCVGV